MQKTQWWPTPQDYNEAVQNLAVNTQDAQLQSGIVSVDSLGLPRPIEQVQEDEEFYDDMETVRAPGGKSQ